MGRGTREKWLNGAGSVINTIDYAYHALGEVTQAADAAASYSYQYDGNGRQTKEEQTIDGLTPAIRAKKGTFCFLTGQKRYQEPIVCVK
jgi:hypothetical protein